MSVKIYTTKTCMWCKKTKSEWDFLGQAINGTLKGEKLRAAPIAYAFWFGWVAEYPDTELFSGIKPNEK